VFEVNSDVLYTEQNERLRDVVSVIKTSLKENKKTKFILWINGHADSSEKNPDRLAEKRAKVVKKKLKNFGLPEGTIIVRSFSTQKPLGDPCRGPGKCVNARVDFQIREE
jgi:outer membrane protein OmpA-like peptidoglycan-associated protein